jgi:hypothetical protein
LQGADDGEVVGVGRFLGAFCRMVVQDRTDADPEVLDQRQEGAGARLGVERDVEREVARKVPIRIPGFVQLFVEPDQPRSCGSCSAPRSSRTSTSLWVRTGSCGRWCWTRGCRLGRHLGMQLSMLALGLILDEMITVIVCAPIFTPVAVHGWTFKVFEVWAIVGILYLVLILALLALAERLEGSFRWAHAHRS